MFKRRTLFVLGAGASHEAGLPVGTKLARIIAKKMNIEIDHFGRPHKAGDPVFFDQFHRAYQQSMQGYFNAFNTIRDGVMLQNSIDDFLNIHSNDPHIVEVGKAAIVRAILEAEKSSLLFVNQSNIHNKMDFAKIEPTWYVKFMRVLGTAVTVPNVSRILDDVAFIVFNYDRCIEHFLTHALQHLYAIPKKAAVEIVDAATFIHPYGSIGQLEPVPFGGREHETFDFISHSKRIKTYTEQIEEGDTIEDIKREVQNAKSIVFLGFAFHSQNMALLKPPSPQRGKVIFATALGMSDADKSEVEDQLIDFFPDETEVDEPAVTLNYHVHVENQLACASLFDHYAKSIGG